MSPASPEKIFSNFPKAKKYDGDVVNLKESIHNDTPNTTPSKKPFNPLNKNHMETIDYKLKEFSEKIYNFLNDIKKHKVSIYKINHRKNTKKIQIN